MSRADIWKDGVDTQFKKGQGGRPKGALSLKSRLKKICTKHMMYKTLESWVHEEKKEIYTIIAEQLVAKAMKGDINAIKMVINYLDEEEA